MQRKFLGSLLLMIFLNFLVKPFWIFGIDLTVQHRVGISEYGTYFALFNFSIIFNILLDLGLTHYNNQSVSKKPEDVVKNFANLTSLKFLLGVAYTLVTLVVGFISGYSGLAFRILLILSVNQFLASFILFIRSSLSGLQFFNTDSVLSVVDKTLMIVLCGLLLFTNLGPKDFTITHYALAQMLSYILSAGIAFFVAWKKIKNLKWKVSLRAYRWGLKRSFPYALLILLMALYTRVDGIMLERMAGPLESGIYGACFRLLDITNQLSYLFAVLLLPMFGRMLAQNQDVSSLTKTTFSLLITALLSIVLVCVFYNKSIIEIMNLAQGADISTPLQWLIISSLGFGTAFIFGTLLTSAGELRILNAIALSGFVINILLNFLMIPKYGASGAAFATVLTQVGTAVAQVVFAFTKVKLKFTSYYFLRLLILFLGSLLLSYGIFKLELGFFLAVIAIIASVFTWSLILKILNIQSFISVLKLGAGQR